MLQAWTSLKGGRALPETGQLASSSSSGSGKQPITPVVSLGRERRRRDWQNSALEEQAHEQGECLRASLLSSSSSISTDSLGSTAGTPPQPKPLKGRQLDRVTGSDNGRVSESEVRCAVYTPPKYEVTSIKTATDAGTMSQTHASPMETLAEKPWHALAHDPLPHATATLAADSVLSALITPLAFIATTTSWLTAREALQRRRELKQKERSLQEERAKLDDANEADPITQARAAAVDEQIKSVTAQRRVNKYRFWENLYSTISAGAFGIKTALGLGVKFAAIVSGKGASWAAGASSGSSVLAGLGAAGAFALGPLASVALVLESIFLLRKSSRLRKQHKEAAPETEAHIRALAASSPEGIDGEGFADYKAFLLRKLGMRAKFFRGYERLNRLRVAACAVFAATTLTKMGIAIAAVTTGGFVLSNPAGWALLGLSVGIGLIVTVGAFVFVYSRRSSRYEQYQREDDPLIDREFHRAVVALEATRAPDGAKILSTPESPPPAPVRQAPVSVRDSQPVSVREQVLDSATGRPRRVATKPESKRNQDRERAETYASLLEHAQVENDDSDADDDDTAPTHAHHGGHFVAGINARSSNYRMVMKQLQAHQRLQARLQQQFGKRPATGMRGFMIELHARLRAGGAWMVALLVKGRRGAGEAFREKRARNANDLMPLHFRASIANQSREWRHFMASHLASEKDMLSSKMALRKSLARNADDDHPLVRREGYDEARLDAIEQLLEQLENPGNDRVFDVESIPDPATNRKFLDLISNQGGSKDLDDGQVIESLCRAMHLQYRRRLTDLGGMLLEVEHDAARVRMAEQRKRTGG